jgi:hypothetical protein
MACLHMVSGSSQSWDLELQVFPEEFAAVDDAAAAHVEQIYGEHAIFIVIAEDVGVVAFGGGDALAFLQLLDGGNQIAVAGGALVLLRGRGLLHALVQRAAQIRGTAFEKKFHVAHGFLISIGRGQVLHARAQAAFDVVLQAGARMKAREVDLARWNQKVAVNEIDDAIGKIGREVRPVVSAAVLAQAAGDVDARPALTQVSFT